MPVCVVMRGRLAGLHGGKKVYSHRLRKRVLQKLHRRWGESEALKIDSVLQVSSLGLAENIETAVDFHMFRMPRPSDRIDLCCGQAWLMNI